MSKYYLARYNISGTNSLGYDKHLYLIQDADENATTTDDQKIIRLGAENNSPFDIFIGNPGRALQPRTKVLFVAAF